jgi:hypothetical protein
LRDAGVREHDDGLVVVKRLEQRTRLDKPVAAGGGGGPSIVSLFTANTYSGGIAPITAASGITFPTGLVVIGIAFDAVGLALLAVLKSMV